MHMAKEDSVLIRCVETDALDAGSEVLGFQSSGDSYRVSGRDSQEL